MKLGRNDICWCGSGKKYKSCHLNIDSKLEEMKLKGYKIPTRRMMRSPEQIEVNAKGVMAVMSLGAKKGQEILIKVEGENEAEDAANLKAFVQEHL